MVVGAMMFIYVLLGTSMEELSMVLLTIPVFFPIVTGLGFDPVWFGVLIVLVVQIGLISPPVGMNLFVLNTLLKDMGADFSRRVDLRRRADSGAGGGAVFSAAEPVAAQPHALTRAADRQRCHSRQPSNTAITPA